MCTRCMAPRQQGYLSLLGRLFTRFIQRHGFTCGLDDMLLNEAADAARRESVERGTRAGKLPRLRLQAWWERTRRLVLWRPLCATNFTTIRPRSHSIM